MNSSLKRHLPPLHREHRFGLKNLVWEQRLPYAIPTNIFMWVTELKGTEAPPQPLSAKRCWQAQTRLALPLQQWFGQKWPGRTLIRVPSQSWNSAQLALSLLLTGTIKYQGHISVCWKQPADPRELVVQLMKHNSEISRVKIAKACAIMQPSTVNIYQIKLFSTNIIQILMALPP